MGNILINVPDLSDDDLIYNENETRVILKFFWPSQANKIDAMTIDNDARRLAQTMLIAAIDGTYAMGYVDILQSTLARPARGIGQLARRLAIRFVRHWWRHTQPRHLENVRIYDSIRDAIAGHLRSRLILLQSGASLKRGNAPFYALIQSVNKRVWC